MVLDKIGTDLLPRQWEMWTTGTKFMAQRADATEKNKLSYTKIMKTRGEAIRAAKQLIIKTH